MTETERHDTIGFEYGDDYYKNRTTAQLGEAVQIPESALGLTVADYSLLGETVQLSWLEPVEDTGPTRQVYVNEIRSDYTDDRPVRLATWARSEGVTVFEPADSLETVVFYLEAA
jgi:hypothetical protein